MKRATSQRGTYRKSFLPWPAAPLIVAALTGAGLGAPAATAGVIFWDGGGTNNNWSLTANWSLLGTSGTNSDTTPLPASSDDVVFYRAGGARLTTGTLDTAFTIQSFTLGNGQTGAVTIGGPGTLTLNGNANYDPSILNSGASANLGAVGLYLQSGTGALTINAPLQLGGAQQWINNSANPLTITGNISNGSNTLTIAGTGATLLSGILGNGAGGLTKIGSGTLTLNSTGVNTYTGPTTVNGGVLALRLLNPVTANLISSSSALVLGGGTLSLTNSYKNHDGTQTFAGLAVNPGASAIRSGTDQNGNTTMTLNLGAITRHAGGTADLSTFNGGGSSSATITTLTANSHGILGGWATFAGDTWAVSAGTGTVAGAITGLATYGTSYSTATSTSNFDATTSGTFTATSINSLRFNNANARTATLNGIFALATGGILVTSTVGANASTITGGTSLTSGNGQDLIVIQNNTAARLAIASLLTGSGIGLTKSGAGLLVLTNPGNNFTGTTFINAGILQLGDGTSGHDGVIPGNITNDAALAYDLFAAQTYAGAISGTGTLTQSGGGALTLSHASSYTGVTTINAGKLLLDGSIPGAVVVNSGGILGGTGAIGGAVTVNTGGHVAPGHSIGTLSTGALVLSGTSDFELGNATGSGTHASPFNSDRINVTGNLTLGGTLNLIDNAGANGNGALSVGAYELFTYTGSLLNATFGTVSGPAGYSFVVNTSTAGSVFLDVTAPANNNTQIMIAAGAGVTQMPATGASSTTIAFGNVLRGANLYNNALAAQALAKTGTNTTTYTVTSAGSARTSFASGSLPGGSQTLTGNVALNTSSFNNAASGTVTIANTAANAAAVGLGSLDANDIYTVTANVGDATADHSNSLTTFGPALTATVTAHSSASYANANLSSQSFNSPAKGGLATIVYAAGNHNTAQVSMAWRTPTTFDWGPLFTDVVRLDGFGTDTVVLEMFYNTTGLSPATEAALFLGRAVGQGNRWVNAGSDALPKLGAWSATFDTLGQWGQDTVDPQHYVWAVVPLNADPTQNNFAVIPEPASASLLLLGALGLLLHKRRKCFC